MPGARILSTVTMLLMAPMMDEAPRMWTAKIPKSMPGPICRDSGAYMVQPAALAPTGTKNDVSIRVATIGSRTEEATSALQEIMGTQNDVLCLNKHRTKEKNTHR